MRRLLLLVLSLAVVGLAGGLLLSAINRDREYQRLIEEGDRALAAEQTYPALEAYSGAIALVPDAMLAYLKRGITYRERGELEEAQRDLRRAAELDPTATQPLELLGDVLAALQRYDRAAERYEAYLALDDKSARVLYKLALAYFRHGSPDRALEPLDRALALQPDLAEARYLRGICLRDAGRLEEARVALEEAARLAPGLLSAREALADVHRARGDTRRMVEQLEALAALEPGRPERWIAVGLAHARAGRHEAAVVALGHAVDRFPDSSRVYAALGQVWLETAEARNDRVALGKALEALTLAAARADAGGSTLALLGRAWLRAGDAASAERYLRQAVARLPVPPDAYGDLAQAAERRGDLAAAREALLRYAVLVGDDRPLAGVAVRIAELSIRLGDSATAAYWLDRAADVSGASPALLARLAEARLAIGHVGEARQLVQKGLGLDPAYRPLLALQRRLP